MEVQLNPRGNGACPFCAVSEHCHVHETLKKTLSDMNCRDDSPMELVIYSCPYFNEK